MSLSHGKLNTNQTSSIMKIYIKILLTLGCLLLLTQTGISQNRVLFAIDMSDQIESGEFEPGDTDVMLTGDQLPFSSTNNIEMYQSEQADSIYVATVDFPESTEGKTLQYNFIIENDGERFTEDRSRVLNLKDQDGVRRLDLALFNSFAQ
jgi:hypothetical protein